MHTDDTRIATGDPRAASSINSSPVAQSRWKGELGDSVVVMTTVRDEQDRPVAGVPVIWHLTTTHGGEHHGQIVTGTGQRRQEPTQSPRMHMSWQAKNIPPPCRIQRAVFTCA